VFVDLGEVHALASVRLNGHDLSVVWKSPFAINATNALRAGRNELEVRVVNTWVNRLIADAALPADQRLTWTTDNPYRATDPLVISGLLGLVCLREGELLSREWRTPPAIRAKLSVAIFEYSVAHDQGRTRCTGFRSGNSGLAGGAS
jgi:hypothetical protein